MIMSVLTFIFCLDLHIVCYSIFINPKNMVSVSWVYKSLYQPHQKSVIVLLHNDVIETILLAIMLSPDIP